MCEPDWKGGFIGSAFYFFWCLSLLYVPRQADKVGRRWLFLSSRFAARASAGAVGAARAASGALPLLPSPSLWAPPTPAARGGRGSEG